MNIEKLVKDKRSEIMRVALKHGATNVRVFGSVARGESDEQSDVDLLVDMEQGRSLLDRAALVVELETLLNCKVDVATERVLKPAIKQRIIKEAIPL